RFLVSCLLLSFPTRRSSDLSNAVCAQWGLPLRLRDLAFGLGRLPWSFPDSDRSRTRVSGGGAREDEAGMARMPASGAPDASDFRDRKSTRLNSSHQIISYAV